MSEQLDRAQAIYDTMVNNCYNANMDRFKFYGGTGITVCARWRRSFDQFIADVGVPKPGDSLVRINKRRGYTPKNARWVDKDKLTTEFHNRLTLVIGYKGVYMKCGEWTTHLGYVNRSLFIARMRRYHWSFMDCIRYYGIKDDLDDLVGTLDRKIHNRDRFDGCRILSSRDRF